MIILYEILKKLIILKVVYKVINEKEFMVIKFINKELMHLYIDDNIWKIYNIKNLLHQNTNSLFEINFEKNLIYNKDITLKFNDNIIYNLNNNKSYEFTYNNIVLKRVLEKILSEL